MMSLLFLNVDLENLFAVVFIHGTDVDVEDHEFPRNTKNILYVFCVSWKFVVFFNSPPDPLCTMLPPRPPRVSHHPARIPSSRNPVLSQAMNPRRFACTRPSQRW